MHGLLAPYISLAWQPCPLLSAFSLLPLLSVALFLCGLLLLKSVCLPTIDSWPVALYVYMSSWHCDCSASMV